MKFGPVPVAEAGGAVAAHSVPLPDGRLRKGQVIGPAEVARLQAAGLDIVVVARPGLADVGEDAAAARLARVLVADGIRATPATTGRVNLYATAAGVFAADAQAIVALNMVDPSITLATLPALSRVDEGTLLGTVKIIAYAVPEVALAGAEQAARGALRLARPQLATATLIETTLDAATPPDKGRRAMAARLQRLGVTLGPRVVVPHRIAPLARAIAAASGEAVFVLTASATSDAADVAPAALVAAGGTLARFGLPVDPGNLLFHGDLGPKPVIGLPGCARSPALNGADWVLERRLCGIAVTDRDVAAMGVGGLLKETRARGRPREG